MDSEENTTQNTLKEDESIVQMPAEYNLTIENLTNYLSNKLLPGVLVGGLFGAGYSYYMAENMMMYTLTYSYGFGIATSSIYTGFSFLFFTFSLLYIFQMPINLFIHLSRNISMSLH
jgi:hypothetical protein